MRVYWYRVITGCKHDKHIRLAISTNLKHPQSLFRLQKVAQECSSAENRPHAQVDILMQQRFHRDDCAQCCTRRSILRRVAGHSRDTSREAPRMRAVEESNVPSNQD